MIKERTYTMYRYEIVVPITNNEGQFANYMQFIRQGLISRGFTGWTENASTGFWVDPNTKIGKFENGTVITIYSEGNREFAEPIDGKHLLNTLELLCEVARSAMPDQIFIQVTKSESTVTLIEA